MWEVKQIEAKQTHKYILEKHYAQRLPSISFAYGLFQSNELKGILTIGKPASPPLCAGIMGSKYKHVVYELNRLVVVECLPKNSLSYFVAEVLRMLSNTELLLVSFADDGVGHNGYIYQATNWIYTGKTKERTDKYMPGNKHPRHYNEIYSHIRKCRTAKHRYIYIPNKRKRKEYMEALKYDVKPYPKGDNKYYVLGERAKTKCINTTTGDVFYE